MILLTRCLDPPRIINRLMIISYFVYLIELFLNLKLQPLPFDQAAFAFEDFVDVDG
jgi:hypothetical protein